MRKTIGLIVVLVIALVMLTGCVNVNYEVKVNNDGSGDISYLYVFSKESLETLQVSAEDMVASMKEQAEKSKYVTEVYEDDTSAGFKATKHLDDLSKHFSLKEAFGEEYVKEGENNKENGIKIKNSLFKTSISQNAEIDLTEMDDVASIVSMKYTVKLPVKVDSNNASEVSKNGKELTWNLKGGEINRITFSTTRINIVSIVIFTISIIAVIAAVVYYFFFFKKMETKE